MSEQALPKEEEKKEEKKETAKPAKKGKKNKKKLEAERKAEEERQRLLKEQEEKRKAEEEEKIRIEEEKRAKEEAERKALEEKKRLEAEERERELAEKIVLASDNEEIKEEEKERPEDKLYDYNGKRIKANLLKSDVTNDIKEKAFEMGFLALGKFTAEKEMSEFIKIEFDKLFEPEWQIIIGKDFSVAFSFEIENFVFFQIEDIYFLFYKL